MKKEKRKRKMTEKTMATKTMMKKENEEERKATRTPKSRKTWRMTEVETEHLSDEKEPQSGVVYRDPVRWGSERAHSRRQWFPFAVPSAALWRTASLAIDRRNDPTGADAL